MITVTIVTVRTFETTEGYDHYVTDVINHKALPPQIIKALLTKTEGRFQTGNEDGTERAVSSYRITDHGQDPNFEPPPRAA